MVYLYTNNSIPDMKFQVFFIPKFCNIDNALFAQSVQKSFNNSLQDAEIWLTLCCVRIFSNIQSIAYIDKIINFCRHVVSKNVCKCV